jgi:hypothetical protein
MLLTLVGANDAGLTNDLIFPTAFIFGAFELGTVNERLRIGAAWLVHINH